MQFERVLYLQVLEMCALLKNPWLPQSQQPQPQLPGPFVVLQGIPGDGFANTLLQGEEGRHRCPCG